MSVAPNYPKRCGNQQINVPNCTLFIAKVGDFEGKETQVRKLVPSVQKCKLQNMQIFK